MALYMYDAAYAPNLDQVVAHGGIAMSCYLTGPYATTSAQPAALHAKGIGALGNYEREPGELLTAGVAGGVGIGQTACSAYIGKGAPAGQGLGIAYSVDVDAPASSYGAIGQSFDGINQGAAGRFATLVYGQGGLIDYLIAHHDVVGVEWLSGSKSFPGYNPADPNVGLVQLVGSPVAGTDQDTITNLAALAKFIWWPAGSPYANGGDDMAAADVAAIKADMDAMEKRLLAQINAVPVNYRQHQYNMEASTNAIVAQIRDALPAAAQPVDIDALARSIVTQFLAKPAGA